MIFTDLSRALDQLGDPRFRAVVLRGVGLTLLALLGSYMLVYWGVGWLVGDGLTLPYLGTLSWTQDLLSIGSVVLMLGLSVFLMVPIATAIQSLFLDDVAAAVEARHYPGLPPAKPVPIADALADGLQALVVLIGANLVALLFYVIFPPFAPVIFYGLNGFLLGREYFQVAAMRREGRPRAQELRRRHLPQIWLAGIVMAPPLTIPIVNLLIPVIGAASFTHLYHRVSSTGAMVPK